MKFSYDDFLSLWKEIAASHKENSPGLYLAMTTQKPRINNEHHIVLKVDNSIQQDLIHQKKPALLSILHKKLRNYAIDIRTEISRAETVKQAYLPKEKLEKLMQKNPEIRTLIQQMGLDFPY